LIPRPRTAQEVHNKRNITNLLGQEFAGPEKSKLEDADIAFHEPEYQRLRSALQSAHDASMSPELPSEETRAALNDLLVRMRLGTLLRA
jgi:uncharacterized protein